MISQNSLSPTYDDVELVKTSNITPLLKTLEPETFESISTSEGEIDSKDNQPLLKTDLKILWKDFLKVYFSSFLISFSFLSSLILLIINLHYIGRFNDPALISAIGLGNVLINSLAINLQTGYNYGF